MSNEILITGGTSGIGFTLAKYYIKQGQNVTVCGFENEDFNKFKSQHSNLKLINWDVRDKENGKNHFIKTYQNKKINKLILCAGVNDGKAHIEGPLDFERAQMIIDINLKGMIHTLDLADQYLAEGSQIVFLSSATALIGFPTAPAYIASKAATTLFSESLRIRYFKRKIAVTCLMPGYIDTPLARSTFPQLEKMPFVLTLDQALPKMIWAIDNKINRYIFPWQIRILSTLLSLIPRNLFTYFYTLVPSKKLVSQIGGAKNNEQ